MQYFDETGSCGCTGLNSACHRTISACRVNAGETALNPILDGVRAYPILDGGGKKSPPSG